MMQLTLAPSITGNLGTIELSNVLQMLESSQASGTVYAGDHYLRLAKGRVVKASLASPACAIARMALQETFSIRLVPGRPNGDMDVGVTALLLEAARIADEARS